MTFRVRSRCRFRQNTLKLFCQCSNCKDVVVVTAIERLDADSIPENWTGNLCERYIQIQSIMPIQSEPVAPEDTPKPVAKEFVEGLSVLRVRAFSSAGNCFRRALEKATNHLLDELGADATDHRGMNLYSRIRALRDRSLIAPQLYDWAEIIRDLGNMGSHGDSDFSEKDAVELKNFTGIFLFYVFTMPAKVRRMRDASHPNDEE